MGQVKGQPKLRNSFEFMLLWVVIFPTQHPSPQLSRPLSTPPTYPKFAKTPIFFFVVAAQWLSLKACVIRVRGLKLALQVGLPTMWLTAYASAVFCRIQMSRVFKPLEIHESEMHSIF